MTNVIVVEPAGSKFMEILSAGDDYINGTGYQYIPVDYDKPIMLTIYINRKMSGCPKTKVYIYKNAQDFLADKHQITDICANNDCDYCFVTTVEELVFHEPNV